MKDIFTVIGPEIQNKYGALALKFNSGCIFCNKEIPEGLMVCPICENSLISGRCSICNCVTESLPICERCERELRSPYEG